MITDRAMRLFHWRWNTIGRLAAGLASLGAALLMAAAMWLDAPEAIEQAQHREALLRENVARAALPLIERDDRVGLQSLLERVLGGSPAWSAVMVRRSDGVLLALARAPGGAPDAGDSPPARPGAAWQRLTLDSSAGTWGAIEFQPRDGGTQSALKPSNIWQWIAAAAALGLLAFGVFYLYLQRALAHLDPASVIPDRVRDAFDVLTQGVLFLDAKGRIVLANAAFRAAYSADDPVLTGRPAAGFAWLAAAVDGSPIWTRVMRLGQPVRDESYRVPQPDGSERRVIVHAVPVLDAERRSHGCVLTFDDLTALDTANAELRQALDALEASRAQIALQNVRLQQMASRDPLTDCLNRRALEEAGGPLLSLARRQREPVSCVMFDIDHFKRVNDEHGHGVGDAVIRSLAGIASRRIRGSDLLCRYGGEEFCLVLPYTPVEAAAVMAEALRAAVESECGAQSGVPNLRVTASFGVASTFHGATTLAELMALADRGLYAAKRSGRNRVETVAMESEAARTLATETATPT